MMRGVCQWCCLWSCTGRRGVRPSITLGKPPSRLGSSSSSWLVCWLLTSGGSPSTSTSTVPLTPSSINGLPRLSIMRSIVLLSCPDTTGCACCRYTLHNLNSKHLLKIILNPLQVCNRYLRCEKRHIFLPFLVLNKECRIASYCTEKWWICFVAFRQIQKEEWFWWYFSFYQSFDMTWNILQHLALQGQWPFF